MDLISILCRICVAIELFYLVFYRPWIKKDLKPILEIFKACEYFGISLTAEKALFKIASKNKYLKPIITLDVNYNAESFNEFQQIDIKKTKEIVTNKALIAYCKDNPNGLLKFVFLYAVEIVYRMILFVLCVRLQNLLGAVLFVASILVSGLSTKIYYSDKFNIYWDCFEVADCVFFICLYMWIDYYF